MILEEVLKLHKEKIQELNLEVADLKRVVIKLLEQQSDINFMISKILSDMGVPIKNGTKH